ncbi:UDP-N-acetylmuramoylalanyl-D-glutamyl-2, 6-diaminopimelate--D-alanyl-D-alanine ligase [Tamilnaduibacter salinus]|uniref:UDP-N-acetylmuramoyl-tripeptide--D-alanyl-D-alanine ligase n=1 Tax=Tamilnaduibacter salinus TaxID=1484056 RepID=A0A2A2I4U6_9GAMM|nr:UDP-N-acetylmuramoyl-tripeptide--D-alanyl-D-alanine ligase [Tamilnaduibacter salinus]PAV26043.1 UDP-N-acetylmuramoylalanyl-D-glutamyl-2, 6-diaminopimelate--D-alanyl-D-alanine ligase [Tamilnaduibacter salinus]
MIRPFSLSEAATMIGAQPPEQSGTFSEVSIDTRTLSPGALFIALRGERFDGHDFLSEAARLGAVAAVVDTEQPGAKLPQLVVEDTVTALGQLGRGNRSLCEAGVAAITGSSGKTTVKEMLAGMCLRSGPTLATEGNRNNHIGVPLTLFRLCEEHQYAVIELGASGVGEINDTVNLVQPTVALITIAGDAHLEGFGSYENIVLGKGEIIDGVSENGTVVLNADDPACEQWRDRAGHRRVWTVSVDAGRSADFRLVSVAALADGESLTVCDPEGRAVSLTLRLPGAHNRTNAMLALAAARALGVDDDAIDDGLASVGPVEGRLQVHPLGAGRELIDDSYNANPGSLSAALTLLSDKPGRRVAVLGTMAELGPDAARLHEQAGQEARLAGVDRLLALGPNAEDYCRGFGEGSRVCSGHDEAIREVLPELAAAVTVLVKGSRSSAMETVARAIKTKVQDECCSG